MSGVLNGLVSHRKPSINTPRIKSHRLENKLKNEQSKYIFQLGLPNELVECEMGDAIVEGQSDRTNRRIQFAKELKKVLRDSNVILEVLDARDPLGTRSLEIEKHAIQLDPQKRIVLLLNKADLVLKENLEEWIKFLRTEYPTIAFSHGKHGGSDCCSELTCLLKNYCRSSSGVKMQITVGIVGIPNVGKSSVINALKRSKTVTVAPIAGSTRVMQEVMLDKNIRLLDCPGLVLVSDHSEAEAVLRNSIRIENVVDFVTPIEIILSRVDPECIQNIYQIFEYNSVEHFLLLFAEKHKLYMSGGLLNLDAAAKRLIKDWNSGKIPHYSKPPKRQATISTRIVNDDSIENGLQLAFSAKMQNFAPFTTTEQRDVQMDLVSSSVVAEPEAVFCSNFENVISEFNDFDI